MKAIYLAFPFGRKREIDHPTISESCLKLYKSDKFQTFSVNIWIMISSRDFAFHYFNFLSNLNQIDW